MPNFALGLSTSYFSILILLPSSHGVWGAAILPSDLAQHTQLALRRVRALICQGISSMDEFAMENGLFLDHMWVKKMP
jgi:uncharacterized membrane protein SpoIIM required for sporulation